MCSRLWSRRRPCSQSVLNNLQGARQSTRDHNGEDITLRSVCSRGFQTLVCRLARSLAGRLAMKRAAIVSPIRTGVGKYMGALSDMTAGDLGAVVLKALVERTKIDPEKIDDVIFAQGYGSGEAPCIARWSALAAGLPIEIP